MSDLADPERPRVLVREPIAEAGLELLRRSFDVVEDRESDLASIIGDFDAIVVRSATTLDAQLIDRALRLKVIGRAGVGIDNVDVDAATRRGIVVANAPESTVVSASEHTIGLLVALARNIPQAHAALKDGRWERSAYGGTELAGKRLGVLGFGRIGQQVARRALGLGMHVIACDPYVTGERFRELGVERAEAVEDVYDAADFLTLHLPLTAETRGSIGAAAFDRHAALGRACREGAKAMGLELFSPDEDRSAVVTAIRAPDGIDGGEIVSAMRDRFGITIASGQGELKGKVFRIGHIGWFDVFDITTALAALELALLDAGAEIERGIAVTRALEAYTERAHV